MRVITCLLTMLISSPVLAGALWGNIPASQSPQKEKGFEDGCFWRLGPLPESRSTTKSFVVLEGSGARQAPAINQQVQLIGYSFVPAFIVATKDTTLTFMNRDGHPYSCSAEGANAFGFEALRPGDSREHKLAAEGVTTLKCHQSPFMQATLVVVSSPLVTFADREGRFSFQKVPGGEYVAKAFVAGDFRHTGTARIPEAGGIELNFGAQSAKAAQPAAKPAVQTTPPPVEKKPPAAAAAPPARKPEEAKPVQAPKAAEVKPEPPKPAVKKPAEAGQAGEGKTPPQPKPAVEKKPPPEPKKPPAAGPAAKPAFEDVEPEIEIEE